MRDYRKVMLAFYRYVSGVHVAKITDIPEDSLQFMAGMEYADMVRPIVVQALREGSPVKSLADYWGVDPNFVRNIRRQYKISAYQK